MQYIERAWFTFATKFFKSLLVKTYFYFGELGEPDVEKYEELTPVNGYRFFSVKFLVPDSWRYQSISLSCVPDSKDPDPQYDGFQLVATCDQESTGNITRKVNLS